jgi:signal transduction histidine kinase
MLRTASEGVRLLLADRRLAAASVGRWRLAARIGAIALLLCAARSHAGGASSLSGDCDYMVGFDSTVVLSPGECAWKHAKSPLSFSTLYSGKNHFETVTLRWAIPAAVCTLAARGNPVAMETGRSGDPARFFVNRFPVCSTGTRNPFLAGGDEEGHCIVPSSSFLSASPNYLFAVYTPFLRSDFHGVRVSPTIGRARAILDDYDMSLVVSFFMLGCFMAIAIYYLILGMLRRKDRYNLHFGLLTLSFSFFMSANTSVKSFLYSQFDGVGDRVDVCSGICMTLFFLLFITSYVSRSRNRAVEYCSVWLGVLAVAACAVGPEASYAVRIAWYATTFAVIPFLVRFVVVHAIGGSFDAWVVAAGLAVFIVSGLHDFFAFFGLVPFSFTMPYAFVVFILIMTVLLARKFAAVYARLEELNEELDKKVRDRTAELQASNVQKDRIIGAVAHDLKNPIGAILLTTTLLERSGPQGTTGLSFAESTNLIKQACSQAMNTITTLLDQARARETGAALSAEKVELAAFARTSFNLYQVRAREKGLSLEFDKPKGPVFVRINKSSFTRVIDNILSNAIKFTPANGRVVLRVEPGIDRARLVVADTGIGIPPDIRESVFAPFTTAGRQGTGREASTGLGLSIARDIVEKHGGRIWFESEEGSGTTMYVEIPLAYGEDTATQQTLACLGVPPKGTRGA